MREATASALNSLSFVLQVNGVLLTAPLGLALVVGEIQETIAFALAALASLIIGFLLSNAYRRFGRVTFESAMVLLPLAFFTLGLIGAIPYVYLREVVFESPDLLEASLNGFFESISGYTTTGLTLVPDPSALPVSVTLYRILSQWLGGISLVFMLLLFLSGAGEASNIYGRMGGLQRIRPSFRATFVDVLKIYLAYTGILFAILLAMGGIGPLHSGALALTGLSTGGFLAVENFGAVANGVTIPVAIATMVIGSTNFSNHYKLFTGKGRGEVEELVVHVLILAFGSILMLLMVGSSQGETWIPAFHAIAASTTTGFQASELSGYGDGAKFVLTLLMLIGGATFSSAGGIKVLRFIILLKGIGWEVGRVSLPPGAMAPLKVSGRGLLERETISIYILASASVLSLVVFAPVLTTYGFTLTDSLFELVSALSTTGLSVGIANLGSPVPVKAILIFQMILGRIEVIPLLVLVRGLFRS